jgi:hypothetical protein
MTLFEKKNLLLYLADFWPFGNTNAHFSAGNVDLETFKIIFDVHFTYNNVSAPFLDIDGGYCISYVY